MKKLLISLTLAFVSIFAQAADNEPPRTAYELVVPAQATKTGKEIEVLEVFWYGCPHCYHFEPHLEEWIPTLAEDTKFQRMPGVFRRDWEPGAKVFYTAKVLGILDTLHRSFFDAIHQQKKRLLKESDIADFFVSQGISKEDFERAYNSPTVAINLRRAKLMSPKYGITGVPSIIVDGRYRTSASQAGSYGEMLKVVEQLLEKVRAERSAE